MADVLCLGEILVDWVCTTVGAELDTAQNFTKAAGGAPANVAVGLARQDVATAFIGRVADDAFGAWLKSLLNDEQIDTTCTIVDAEASTRMAYVVTTANGDRKLAEFSRIACADARLQENDLQKSLFKTASVLHFGSISLIAEPAKSATLKAVELAKAADLLLSYDPNIRLGLWPSPEQCKSTILDTLKLADVVKINIDELEFLTGSRQLTNAADLRAKYNIPLLILTLDALGCHIFTAAADKKIAGFDIGMVEATGAGDGFVSAVIAGILPHLQQKKNRRGALQNLSIETLTDICRRANAVGAIACTKAGAIPALPRTKEINAFLAAMSVQA